MIPQLRAERVHSLVVGLVRQLVDIIRASGKFPSEYHADLGHGLEDRLARLTRAQPRHHAVAQALPVPLADARVDALVPDDGELVILHREVDEDAGMERRLVHPQRGEDLARTCERVGRDPQTLKLSVALPTLVGGSDAELELRAAAIGRTVDQLRGDVNIVGGRDEVVAKVERLVAIGAQRVYFQLMDLQDVSHVEFLGTEVLPHLPR